MRDLIEIKVNEYYQEFLETSEADTVINNRMKHFIY